MRTFISPSRYYQGPGLINRIGEFASQYGAKALILVSKNGIARSGDAINESFRNSEAGCHLEIFGGESSQKEIDRVAKVAKSISAEVMIGVGGGKIADTVKAAAYSLRLPVIVVPTVASSDAPCSALAVIYTDDGADEHYKFMRSNPNLVLVDSDIIAKSPTRFTVSGMGDGLATYIEARASYKHDGDNLAGLSAGGSLKVGQAVAKLCFDLLKENGVKAKIALDTGVLTPAVEAVHNGFSVLPECHHNLHGEKVAFGVITQLVLENAPKEELDEILDFCVSVGLPVTMAEVGVTDPTPEKIMHVAELACDPNDTGVNMPFAINPEMVYNAIYAADAFGKIALEKK